MAALHRLRLVLWYICNVVIWIGNGGPGGASISVIKMWYIDIFAFRSRIFFFFSFQKKKRPIMISSPNFLYILNHLTRNTEKHSFSREKVNPPPHLFEGHPSRHLRILKRIEPKQSGELAHFVILTHIEELKIFFSKLYARGEKRAILGDLFSEECDM